MSETRNMIVATATRLFEEKCTPEVRQAVEKGAWAGELWSIVEQTGLTLAGFPEELGGAGGSLRDALAVLRVGGQFAAPLPLAETYLAGWVLTEAGLSLPEGPLAIAFSHQLFFARHGDGWQITGRVTGVPWARFARQIIVVGLAEDGPRLALISPDRAELKPGKNLAGEPRDTLTFNEVEVGETAPAIDLEELAERLALCRATQVAGALEGIFNYTIRHAAERVQFGKLINTFQAIQQQLALLAGEVTAARIAVEAAAVAVEQGDAPDAIATAKIRTAEAAGQAAAIAHQVHGAMGFTTEYPLHYLTKRLWAWRDEAGSESEWARQLGRQVAARGADNFWAFITGQ